jgi:hypothetical protein
MPEFSHWLDNHGVRPEHYSRTLSLILLGYFSITENLRRVDGRRAHFQRGLAVPK